MAIQEGARTTASSSASPAPAVPRPEAIEDFEPFFRRHEREIFAYLWRMTGDEHGANDLAQETFLRAWQHFARIRDFERPGGWLFRVATHLALNHLRDRSARFGVPRPTHSGESGRPTPRPAAWPEGHTDDLAGRVAEADLVRRALMAVSPRQRAALILREVYGLPCDQVAATLGTSVGGAKTLLWRARDEFRSRYAEEDR